MFISTRFLNLTIQSELDFNKFYELKVVAILF